MIVKPFRGLRPSPSLSSTVPSYPYDVVNTEEAREIAKGNPQSFLHVVKPEIDLDPATDPYDASVYAKGRENLVKMLDEGWLAKDQTPSFYLYQLEMDGQSQTGVIGAAAVADYREGKIKKHEFTRPQKENDRVELNYSLKAHPGPVFLTYRPDAKLDAWMARYCEREPQVNFTATDGIRHTLWVVADLTDVAAIESMFADMPATYVADGHHRTAAAARVGQRMSSGGIADANAPYSYFLAVHFPSDQLRVLDYNRVVKDLNGLSAKELVAKIAEAGFTIEAGYAARKPERRGRYGMYVDGTWYRIDADPAQAPTDVVQRLDVSVLTDRILQPLLGIGDPRTDARIDFVGGIRGMDELERRVDSGRDAIAFSLFPTSLEEVMDVADADQVMPPKSTWFEPKLRSGMVVQSLEGDSL